MYVRAQRLFVSDRGRAEFPSPNWLPSEGSAHSRGSRFGRWRTAGAGSSTGLPKPPRTPTRRHHPRSVGGNLTSALRTCPAITAEKPGNCEFAPRHGMGSQHQPRPTCGSLLRGRPGPKVRVFPTEKHHRVLGSPYDGPMRGDRVEVTVDIGTGVKVFDVVATRAGRRVEVTPGRTIVEVTEVTRSGTPVRTARFMTSRVVALVEHPARQASQP